MENGCGSAVERVAEYDRQYRDRPVTADQTILLAARDLLAAQLQSGPISAELAHAGQRVYWHLGEKARLVELLERYLTQPLPVEEAVWARWPVMDNLAMLHRKEPALNALQEARQLDSLRRAAQATAARLDARIASRGGPEGLSPAERRWVGIVAHHAA